MKDAYLIVVYSAAAFIAGCALIDTYFSIDKMDKNIQKIEKVLVEHQRVS